MNTSQSQESIVLHIPAKLEYFEVVRATLYSVASKMGFCFEDIEDMKIAVTEACEGALFFSSHESNSYLLQLSFIVDHETLTIIVKDEVSGYYYQRSVPPLSKDPSSLKKFDQVPPELRQLMLSTLMDKVRITNDGGTEVILTKQIHRSGWL
ncbi:hypothetical protein SY83_19455 [Paenibacillus swuensis]|uniref:Histidine kinase/HSP90-like ATPase domain-containing protein n=1 Tax=Paenibacillus swuensis TaxID=1178515 RepID=A0A172TM96_9BACL|nr:ATP-binding protein [Paenibacillus swuensis]ANE48102.1 hypothetical protein SY83_19455 [Paenibacillus swuensis]